MLEFEIIHCPLTDVLLFDLFLTTQLFCFPCHCYYQAGDFICLHQTVALCIRQVLAVVVFLHLPEPCIMGSFLFARVSLA